MSIEIVLSLAPRQLHSFEWEQSPAATVEQALMYLHSRSPDFAAQSDQDWQTAVWGKLVDSAHPLKDGDRLEVLRPLRVDPKVARRERFQKQGAKTAGLFAKRRAGAKPGY
ncbi:MAG: RnfH family protein [Limnohabitans sp.]|nr:RnfH family protein [Limnohabitans sp.]